MDTVSTSAVYRLVAELLLHPADRDQARIESLRHAAHAFPAIEPLIAAFLGDPLAHSSDEYVSTLELSPPCPLYLGAYLFDEPSTCRNVGSSPRNAYMLELSGMFRHFGLELGGRELPDYLPAVVEFLALSAERSDRDRVGLRRRLLERDVLPALMPLQQALEKVQSPYARLVSVLERVVEEELRQLADQPAWRPREGPRVDAGDPLTFVRRRKPVAERLQTSKEVHP